MIVPIYAKVSLGITFFQFVANKSARLSTEAFVLDGVITETPDWAS
jgi:hypothetical protein